MPLPVVPFLIVGGTVILTAGGAAAGAVGGVQISRAKKRIRHSTARYESRYEAHLSEVSKADEALRAFGATQERAQHDVIFRMKAFLERNAKQVRAHEHLLLDGVDGASGHLGEATRLDPAVVAWARSVVGAALAGAGTPIAIRRATTALAKASTGMAISNLTGAAADRATLAFIGGGPIKSGGGGMKLGGQVLTLAAVGPAVFIVGLTLKSEGTQAKTKAAEHATQVSIEMAQLDARDALLQGVVTRAQQLEEVLGRLTRKATASLDLLESEPFDVETHAERLHSALVLVSAVREVATAPIVNEAGDLDPGTERLVFRYRARPEDPNG